MSTLQEVIAVAMGGAFASFFINVLAVNYVQRLEKQIAELEEDLVRARRPGYCADCAKPFFATPLPHCRRPLTKKDPECRS